MKTIKTYTIKAEYEKARKEKLKFLHKTYSWYKNIEESMNYWESKNKLVENEKA